MRALGARHIVPSDDAGAAVRTLVPDGVDAVIDPALLGAAVLPVVRDGGRFIAVRRAEIAPERGITIEHVSVRDYQREQAKLRRLLVLAG